MKDPNAEQNLVAAMEHCTKHMELIFARLAAFATPT